MNKQEILASVSMRQVLEERYIKIGRNNMISCPFHGTDKKPSMRIYRDGFRCFACGCYGNVIDFVMAYDKVPFKTAYISLGGTYETQTENERKLAEIRRKRAAKERERKEKAEAELKKELGDCISITREACRVLEPRTDDWCWFQNMLPKVLYAWECKYINNEEVNEIDVFRMCREIRQKLAAIT